MLLIKNGKIVYLDKIENKDILIDDGNIVEIKENIEQKDAEVIDAKGLTIIPGMIDMHCHLRDPGYEYKEDIESGLKAAVKGGFVGVACMPNTNPVVDNVGIIEYIKSKAKCVDLAKVYPVGAISKGLEGKQLAEMGKMKEAGAVAFSDDGNPVSDGRLMKNAFKYAKSFDALLTLHCEDLGIKDDGVMNEGYYSSVLGLRGNSRASEESMTARDIFLAESLGCKVHICHVSTRGAFEIIRQAKKRGVQVTCETMPHYFSADDSWLTTYDTNAKVAPPLRTKDDVIATIEAIKDGTVDAIATDHAPHHEDEKKVEFDIAAFGISGFETALSLMVTNLLSNGVSLSKIVELTSVNPARLLNVDGGIIEKGEKANLTIFSEDIEYVLKKENIVSKGKNTPFIGKNLKGQVCYTIVDGKVKYKV